MITFETKIHDALFAAELFARFSEQLTEAVKSRSFMETTLKDADPDEITEAAAEIEQMRTDVAAKEQALGEAIVQWLLITPMNVHTGQFANPVN